MEIKHIFKLIPVPRRALVFRKITDKEPVIRAMTFRGASKRAREMGIEKPVFMREPVPGAKHVHQ
jgi:hypothetical protein